MNIERLTETIYNYKQKCSNVMNLDCFWFPHSLAQFCRYYYITEPQQEELQNESSLERKPS